MGYAHRIFESVFQLRGDATPSWAQPALHLYWSSEDQ